MATGFIDGVEDCLETRLNRATNPLQAEENWEAIVSFCDMINKDIDGPQTAVRLLTHKIQSPQEKESLFALTTLEACVKNCGLRFQQEVGKFRFINEIIKVISPKYLGNHMSAKVKDTCIGLLYVWSESLKHEPKIQEAYCMLKKQGIVKQDPPSKHSSNHSTEKECHHPYHPPPNPPHQPPTPPTPDNNQIFKDEQKSKLLAKLLKSKNAEDLQAANRLIKSMVKQDEERVEKVTRRAHHLETVMDNVKLLTDMLKSYQPLASNESDVEIMKELSENIEKQRPTLFKLASDSDEKDHSGAIGEILKVNDEVIQVLSVYDSVINHSTVGKLLLLDNEAGTGSKSRSAGDYSATAAGATAAPEAAAVSSLLDEQLLSLDLLAPLSTTTSTPSSTNLLPPYSPLALNSGQNHSKTATTPQLHDLFSSSTFNTPTNNNLLSTTIPSPLHNNILDVFKSQQQHTQLPHPQQHQNSERPNVHLKQQQQQPFLSPFTTTTTNDDKYNSLSDSFNSLVTKTSTSSSGPSSGSSSGSSAGLDVLNKMLLKSLNDSGLKSQLNDSAKKLPMKQLNKRAADTSSSSPFDSLNNTPTVTSVKTPINTLNNTSRNNSFNNLSNNLSNNNGLTNSMHLVNNPLLDKALGSNNTNKDSNKDLSNNKDLIADEHLLMNHLTTTTNIQTTTATTTLSPEADDKCNGFSNKHNNSTTHLLNNNTTLAVSDKGVSDNKGTIKPLKDLSVSLQSFKPGKRKSMLIFEKEGVTCNLHFSDVTPRDDVMVVAMTTTNTSALPIEDFTFLTTVNKGAKVKVQAPTNRNLDSFNPILPPSLISQIILIANPTKEPIKMKFTISYLLDEDIVSELGEVDVALN